MTNTNAGVIDSVEADGRTQDCITDRQAQAFLDNGFLVIRQLLHGEELRAIQDAMMTLINEHTSGSTNPDVKYGTGRKSGKPVLRRIEYVVDKRPVMRALLGHPFMLRTVEKLQGPNFIPTWDSMVLKMPGEGIVVPWHRDDAVPAGCTNPHPIFNVDFYLDDADLKSCVWAIPGSNRWPAEASQARCAVPEFHTEDAVPVIMKAGDVMLHNILVLHGSPPGDGNALRRTVYYEFRPGEIERDFGPHNAEYARLKQRVLLACIAARQASPFGRGETPFAYRPTGDFAVTDPTPPATFRFPHGQYWRA